MSSESASSNCSRKYSRIRTLISSANVSPPWAFRVMYLSWNWDSQSTDKVGKFTTVRTRKPSASASMSTSTNGRLDCDCTRASSFAFDSDSCPCIVRVTSAISACSVRLTFCSEPRSSSHCARRASVFSSLSRSSYPIVKTIMAPKRPPVAYLDKLTPLLLKNPKLRQPIAKRHRRWGRRARNN